MPIIHAETARDGAKPMESQSLIEVQGMGVGCNNGIELKDAESMLCSLLQRVLYQLFADVHPSSSFLHGIACIADMTATANIVRMKDIQADDFRVIRIDSNPCVWLTCKKVIGSFLRQFLFLWECDTLADYSIPYLHRFWHICQIIFPNSDHIPYFYFLFSSARLCSAEREQTRPKVNAIKAAKANNTFFIFNPIPRS